MIHHQVSHQCAPTKRRILSVQHPANEVVKIVFGCKNSAFYEEGIRRLELAVPLLSGSDKRELNFSEKSERSTEYLHCWRDQCGRLWGAGVWPWDASNSENISKKAYLEIFAATEGLHLHRLWNFVPWINTETDGLENYRHFCVGRRAAFETAFEDMAEGNMPAGSAVGIEENRLIVIFLAGEETAEHFENPLQMPAYEYPAEHSPRPPSFARGSIAHNSHFCDAYISGTSAVRGHESVHAGNLDGQISTTLEMLQVIGGEMGLGPSLSAETALARQFIVYVRHPGDLEKIQSRLEKELLITSDVVSYVTADICRHELLLEIEGSVQLAIED